MPTPTVSDTWLRDRIAFFERETRTGAGGDFWKWMLVALRELLSRRLAEEGQVILPPSEELDHDGDYCIPRARVSYRGYTFGFIAIPGHTVIVRPRREEA